LDLFFPAILQYKIISFKFCSFYLQVSLIFIPSLLDHSHHQVSLTFRSNFTQSLHHQARLTKPKGKPHLLAGEEEKEEEQVPTLPV
jgi:hypothetical protein